MSREIEFRVWSMINEPKMIYLKKGMLSDLQTVQNQWIVMQYTGLKDKNGVKIFEGDVIRHRDEDEIQLIAYQNGSFVELHIDNDIEKYGKPIGWYDMNEEGSIFFDYTYFSDIEVIGNIYENPELIGETNE